MNKAAIAILSVVGILATVYVMHHRTSSDSETEKMFERYFIYILFIHFSKF